jgi:hypothetical protein
MKSLLVALLGSTLIVAPITVVDGDTVRADGRVYRLVGFDMPESGDHAQCLSEQLLAARATERLRELLANGKSQAGAGSLFVLVWNRKHAAVQLRLAVRHT